MEVETMKFDILWEVPYTFNQDQLLLIQQGNNKQFQKFWNPTMDVIQICF